MPKRYTLGGESFRIKDEVEARISDILNAEPVGTRVGEQDAPFIAALLALRPEKLEFIRDRRVIAFERGIQPPPLERTICFWAVLEDGTRVHFSVFKAVGLLKPDPA